MPVVQAGTWEAGVSDHRPVVARVGPIRRAGRAVATLLLGGLTTMEVIAAASVTVAVMGLLWATHTVAPERLVTGAGYRAAWILLVLALVRPMTWVPYVLPFVAFRKLFDVLMPQRRVIVRNALANLAAVAVLAGVIWLIVATVQGAGTAILSGMAFATGSGTYATLGTFAGDWTGPRIAIAVGSVVLVRLFFPPLGRDLDLSRVPVLGFADGARGTFDRYLLLLAVVGAVVIGGVALFLARS
jgi:hypothetical protein